MSCIPLTGAGLAIPFSPNMIPNLVFWNDPSNMGKVWKDSAASDPATVVGTDTLGAITDNFGGAAFFTQTVAADEPKLVAWNSSRNGVLFVDATDRLSGNASVLAASNGVPGWTEAFVVELPPALGATFAFVRMLTNVNNTKFHVYMDAGLKFFIQTRRIGADTVSSIGNNTITATGGGRYVVVASVDYLSGAGNVYVNGSNSGLGANGTFAWAKDTTCELLNAGAHHKGNNESGTTPLTGGTISAHGAYSRQLSVSEVALLTSYLNNNHGVY